MLSFLEFVLLLMFFGMLEIMAASSLSVLRTTWGVCELSAVSGGGRYYTPKIV